jgi:hypothetical protein
MNPVLLLIQERDKLLAELQGIEKQYGVKIDELNAAIYKLGGQKKAMHEIEAEAKAQAYDDELPDSIKGTEDGI